ncbi:MAG: potassium transporter Kup [Alphaproteobacteria bacterium]|nr:potassium transporter Kup [Alphaproteobacteria bacterium]MBL7099770.1 potassium transporter Kup [Alphaproteobacteria bacterium]
MTQTGETGWRRDAALTIGALGVVFGDIGTSPLYAMKLSVAAEGDGTPSVAAVFGATSLIFWALVIVVTIKYVVFIMRADNNGEGGVMALAALAHRSSGLGRRVKVAIALASLAGLALFYGDGMLTPAVSVLSALEGVGTESENLKALILPLSLAILIALFVLQRRGTERIGKLFGPVMVLWFVVIAWLGLAAIAQNPQILLAVNPYYGVVLFYTEPWTAFVALGSVVLAVTGCEALYADMGHFGRRPIRLAWIAIALPALVLNYFGQGAMVLIDPRAIDNTFYALAPHWAHYPVVILATMATIIASQAVISGVFSITRQAVQLGQLPRMEIKHTSATEMGQIYVPRINAMLAVGVVLIVLIFKTSDSLAAAYGIAVTGVMVISTFLVALVAVRQWKWSRFAVIAVFGTLGLVDLAFLASNTLKVIEGGWLPLGMAAMVFILIDTWRVGRRVHLEHMRDGTIPIDLFLARAPAERVAGTAIFLASRTDVTPGPMLHSLKHYHVLHERVVLMSILVEDIPFVPIGRRAEVNKLGKGFFEVKLRFGFFEFPDVPQALERCRAYGLPLDSDTSTFFLGRETLVAGEHPDLKSWRISLYTWLATNALSPARFFQLPPNRVVELGTQITI